MKRYALKGNVKITLHNVHNGKNEVIEGENIVTNAVRDILTNNYFGGLDNSKFTPLWQHWFGGVLLYKNAHPLVNGNLDPDDYYPRDNATNELIAHAGDQAPASAVIVSEDYGRGSPASRVISDGVIKQVWEWTPSQGNGLISALSLTHKDTGNVGLGNKSSSFQAFSPFLIVSGSQLTAINTTYTGEKNVFAQYDDNHGLAFYIGDDEEFSPSKTCFQTTKISVYIKLLGYKKMGLFETTSAVNTNVRKFTVNTSITFYEQPSYYFDYENKRLWLFTNFTAISAISKTNIDYTVIDCENGTEYAHGTIVSDTANLAPLSMSRGGGTGSDAISFVNIVKNGNYFYFPTTSESGWNWNNLSTNSYNGFKKININDTSDQTQILFSALQYRQRGGMAGGGLTLIDGAVINGTTAYNCTKVFPDTGFQQASALVNQANSISSYIHPFGKDGLGTAPRYIVANKMVNTTKFNLPSAVTKTASQSMIVEYTLEEVSL